MMKRDRTHYTTRLCSRKGVLCIALIALGSSITLGSGFSKNEPNMPNSKPSASSTIGADVTLDILIKILSELLASPIEKSAGLNGNTSPLQSSADSLILRYPLLGLDESLSQIQIQDGLDSGNELLDLLDLHGDEISLPQVSQDRLRGTVEDMIQELKEL
jgi:hypothetical protein